MGKYGKAIDEVIALGMAGRASRRDVLKRAALLGLSAPMIGTLMRVHGAAAAGKLEVFSWWTSGGEAAALQALFDSYSKANPGVQIVNATVAGGGGNNAQAVLQSRLSAKNPPDSWQTHIGHELYDQYVAPGYCDPITDLYSSEGWTSVVPKGLVDQVTKDGQQYAVPVGVHRGNGLWYNKKVLAGAGVTVGDKITIDQLLQAAETLKGKGVAAFGLGDKDPFVDPQTFENTLLGTIGPDAYMELVGGKMKWDDQKVKDAMTTFGKLLGYVNPDHSGLTWDGASGALMDGKVAFNTMGDWAYGEFVKKNAVENIGWVNFPGTDGAFVLVVDCFTLPKGAPDADNAKAWLKVIGGKTAQEAFNPLKGSIPARTDVDKTKFDAYHQWSMASFAKDKLVPSIAHGEATTPAFKQAIYDAALAFVNDKDANAFASALASAATA